MQRGTRAERSARGAVVGARCRPWWSCRAQYPRGVIAWSFRRPTGVAARAPNPTLPCEGTVRRSRTGAHRRARRPCGRIIASRSGEQLYAPVVDRAMDNGRGMTCSPATVIVLAHLRCCRCSGTRRHASLPPYTLRHCDMQHVADGKLSGPTLALLSVNEFSQGAP